jgi:hypothetical protein
MKGLDQKNGLAQNIRSWAQRAVEWMAAPWIEGLEIESKKIKKIQEELGPKRI